MNESLKTAPGGLVRGAVRVPGDKSLSHRVAMLAGLATGESEIRGFLRSADCLSTLGAVAALGAETEVADDAIRIRGTGGRFRAPVSDLDLGNSGTGMRLLSGLLAGQPFTCTLAGDASLSARPMGRIAKPLEAMGARVELLGAGGCAPIRITGGGLTGIEYALPMASAQVKSCVLLAGLFATGSTAVLEPSATRDHTEHLLAVLGVPVRTDGLRIELDGYGEEGPRFEGRTWVVPGDFSSAAFWLVAAAAAPGSALRVEDVGLNPRRTALLDVLRRMGADVSVEMREEDGCPEPMGTITVCGGELRGTEVGGAEIPNLIDELPLVAVAGALAQGRTVIRDAAELRVKESDRIAVMARNLAVCGVSVTEHDDGMVVEGPGALGGATVSSYGDHRVAMAMLMLGLFCPEPVVVTDTACIATSYPGFVADAAELGVCIEPCDCH